MSFKMGLEKESSSPLMNSFGVFKYMALYSMIQFISVLLLYTNRKAGHLSTKIIGIINFV
jgi:hypothetical protein